MTQCSNCLAQKLNPWEKYGLGNSFVLCSPPYKIYENKETHRVKAILSALQPPAGYLTSDKQILEKHFHNRPSRSNLLTALSQTHTRLKSRKHIPQQLFVLFQGYTSTIITEFPPFSVLGNAPYQRVGKQEVCFPRVQGQRVAAGPEVSGPSSTWPVKPVRLQGGTGRKSSTGGLWISLMPV